MNLKVCTRCKEEKPATHEYWHRDKNKKDGLTPRCKECRNKQSKEYKKKNKKKISESGKKYYQKNKDRLSKKYQENKHKKAEYNKRYREKNKDQIRKQQKRWYESNKEKVAERDKEYYQKNRERYLEQMKKYRLENKEYFEEYNRKYYEENKDKINEQKREYYQENREMFIMWNQNRKALMAELPYTLTKEEWFIILAHFNHECAYCGISEEGLHQEHIIPVSKGGGYEKGNIIPACQNCNLSKHNKDLEDWYPKRESFTTERLDKIIEYQSKLVKEQI